MRHEKVSAKTGKPVDELRLGFETSKGHYVRFTSQEIEALRPESTRTIDVTDFVALAEIDPIFYDRTYWAPEEEEPEEDTGKVVDLMEALEASVRRAREGGSKPRRRRKSGSTRRSA